jgi:predicted enzyme related to lactoylglutathione lyase
LVENNERKLGALFFREGTRLALTPGGLEPEPGAVRVWGKDTAFQIGFRGQNLAELAQVMREKGVSFSGPSYDAQLGYWLTFTDPEGNVARIVEPFALFPSR